jgi:glycosyltransferase involved in cell wall biosynthesis
VKFLVSQKGAREHFLVARALHRQGMLAGLATDWYALKNPVFRLMSTFSRGGKSGAALAARTDEIPDDVVRTCRFRGLWWKWKQRRAQRQSDSYSGFVAADAAFGRAVARMKLPPHDAFFGYAYASLEMLEAERKRGVFTVLDQIDPGPVEFRLVADEMQQHPELAGPPPQYPNAHFDRARREWELANVIVVNSEWSRDAILAAGADPAKIEILPLAYEANAEKQEAESRNSRHSTLDPRPSTAPLRVLFLGQVNVRKGIHYLTEAARLLEREKVHFDVVGAIGVLPATIASAPRNMTFHGAVSRDRASEWYRQSDVFILPTLSDGFALTQLEAMANGLPVITTPNCGRVVNEGKTGFIVPPRDPQALADAVRHFVRQPGLTREMAPACLAAVNAFSVDTYGRQLVNIIERRAHSAGNKH